MQDEPLELPPGHVLDASDPDVLVSRCSDGSSAAAFSARGAGPYGGVRGHRRRSAQPSPFTRRIAGPRRRDLTDRERDLQSAFKMLLVVRRQPG